MCKHWLRGLCKKGAGCEFMHEYHLRKMPECWFFAKYGFCSNGDEVGPLALSPRGAQGPPRLEAKLTKRIARKMQCMYLHVTEDMRVRECPQYKKGFCRLG